MSCPSCHLFAGEALDSPCAACRTLSRISWSIKTHQVTVKQEEAVLSILRTASGALLDLGELAFRESQAAKASPHGAGEPLEKEAEGGDKKEKKRKKEKREDGKKESKRAKKEAEKDLPGEGTAPASSARGSRDLSEVKEEIKSEEDEAELSPEERRRLKEPARVREKEEEEEIEVEEDPRPIVEERPPVVTNDQVESHPAEYGLRSWPERPEARVRDDTPIARRPRAPSFPPPGYHGRVNPRGRRDRPREGRKRNKGQKHKQRGRDWRDSQGWS